MYNNLHRRFLGCVSILKRIYVCNAFGDGKFLKSLGRHLFNQPSILLVSLSDTFLWFRVLICCLSQSNEKRFFWHDIRHASEQQLWNNYNKRFQTFCFLGIGHRFLLFCEFHPNEEHAHNLLNSFFHASTHAKKLQRKKWHGNYKERHAVTHKKKIPPFSTCWEGFPPVSFFFTKSEKESPRLY